MSTPLTAALTATDAVQTIPIGDAPTKAVSPSALSDRIAIARVICILGIVYVHAWTGLNVDELRAQGGSWHSLLYWVLIELLGRSSVPLLSIVSGWLVASSVQRRSFGAFVQGKAKSLLLPMVLWNLIAVAIIVPLATLGVMYAPQPAIGWPMVNEIFHISAQGEIDVQNAFLRDVFICMLAAPLLVRMPSALLAAVFAFALAWCVEGWKLYVLLRPQILLFFLIGIFVSRFRLERSVERLPIWPLTLVFLLMGTGKIWLSIKGQQYNLSHAEAIALFDNALRFVAALFFWKAADILSRSSLSAAIRQLEPYSFLFFCSHVLLIWLIGPSIGPLFGRFGEPGYPLFLLLQPFIMMAAAVLIGQSLMRVWPAAASILSGGRLTGRGKISR